MEQIVLDVLMHIAFIVGGNYMFNKIDDEKLYSRTAKTSTESSLMLNWIASGVLRE